VGITALVRMASARRAATSMSIHERNPRLVASIE